jgi:hypothetical protein
LVQFGVRALFVFKTIIAKARFALPDDPQVE